MQIKSAPAASYRKPRVDDTDYPVALPRVYDKSLVGGCSHHAAIRSRSSQ